MEEYQESNNNKGIFWKVGFGALTLLSGFLGYQLSETKNVTVSQEQTINTKVAELTKVTTSLDSIGLQLEAKKAEIQAYGGKVDELEAAIAQLNEDKRKLKNVNGFSEKNFNSKIAEYKNLLSAKDMEIAKLKEENGVLTTTNQNLNTENQNLNTSIGSLKTEKQLLADSNDAVIRKNRELSEKITIAAALKAQKVIVNILKSNGKEDDGGKYKASRVDKIKVKFHLAENPVTKKESKTVFLKVLDPDGAVISDNLSGSGTFTYNGKETTFTTKKDVTYTNNDQAVDIIYGRGNAVVYRPGHYRTELYSEGFKIGEGSFDIK
ncbi:MAG: hypothetical protein KA313_02250 [Pseudarcicella sp.]|nr:hypothetical protein [Pseudarcicella sp.]MBP6409900.1 hypothetical protein [Pseudarcicella sp.]